MDIKDFKFLIKWANEYAGDDNATFWRMLWIAAEAYPPKEQALLRGFIAAWGIIPS